MRAQQLTEVSTHRYRHTRTQDHAQRNWFQPDSIRRERRQSTWQLADDPVRHRARAVPGQQASGRSVPAQCTRRCHSDALGLPCSPLATISAEVKHWSLIPSATCRCPCAQPAVRVPRTVHDPAAGLCPELCPPRKEAPNTKSSSLLPFHRSLYFASCVPGTAQKSQAY